MNQNQEQNQIQIQNQHKFHEYQFLLDDGHKPGKTKISTNVIKYQNKKSTSFASFYDNVLDESWRQRIYNYAVERGRPWGRCVYGICVFMYCIVLYCIILCSIHIYIFSHIYIYIYKT